MSFTGTAWPPRAAGIAALAALLGLALVALSWRALGDRPELRSRLVPLLGVAGWSVLVAAQIGLGRAQAGRAGAMASRYMTLTTPFWVAVIGLTGAVSLQGSRLRLAARLALAVLGVSVLVSSLWNIGLFEQRWRVLWPMLADARRRTAPDSVLAVLHPDTAMVRDRMQVLRRLHLSFFREGFALPEPAVRLTSFEQSLEVQPPLPKFVAGRVARLRVRVKNPTSTRWSALGRGGFSIERSVRLSYHWRKADGTVVVFDGERTDLPRDLLGGDQLELAAIVRAPEEPGRFTLRLTLVQEGVNWFDEAGGGLFDLDIDVAPSR